MKVVTTRSAAPACVAAALLALPACREEPPTAPAPAAASTTPPAPHVERTDALAVELRTAEGAVVARGRIVLPTTDAAALPQGEFDGRWSLQPAEGADADPQITGEGDLRGYRDGDEVLLDLNPGTYDANHLLTARITDGRLAPSRWEFSGFGGPREMGTWALTPP